MNSSKRKKYLELSYQIGSFIEFWGFKKIHGRVWTVIFLAEKSVDAKMITETLQVSKALVSMTLKDLLKYKVILETPKEGPGSQKYTYNPDILSVILDVLKNREVKMLQQIQKSHAELKGHINTEDEQISLKNLEQIGEMTSIAMDVLSAVLNQGTVSISGLYASLSPNSRAQP